VPKPQKSQRSRVGTPPNVTVRPSNFIPGRYHGWIDDGFLYEC
jgi:hypothetical protein